MDARLRDAIEHTLLAPEARRGDIERLCDEALRFSFAGVCVPSAHVATARRTLADGRVRVVTVIGFPLGCVLTRAKVEETRAAIGEGADEIDVVVHVGALLDRDDSRFEDDLAAVVSAAGGRPVKAILETGLLDDEAKVRGAELAIAAGCAFLKTSTGTPGRGGATVDDVALLFRTSAGRARIKASGGIRTREVALSLLDAGATRLGTSAGPSLVGSVPPPSDHGLRY